MMQWLNNLIIHLDHVFHDWGFHFYDIPAAILLLLSLLLLFWNRKKTSDRKDKYLEELCEYVENYEKEMMEGL